MNTTTSPATPAQEEKTALSQALVRMLPHAEAARLAGRILMNADIIELALADYAEAHPHGSTDRDEASDMALLVQQFRRVLADEVSRLQESPAAAPVTGTSARSIVHTLAEAVLTMPEPEGSWRQAAHDQIWKVGARYQQVWPDATYWKYIREQNETPRGDG
jgi:hypothetical protein